MKKILLLIFDGLSDRPIPELSGRTPLEAARTSNLDRLAEKGLVGTHYAMPPDDDYPTSDEAHFEILGYSDRKYLPGRGVLEALGMGIELGKKDLALRVNFGTVDENLKVIDPRAGNIKDVRTIAAHVKEEKIGPFTFRLYPGILHRGVLVISGSPVTKEIKHHSTIVSDTDPHKAENHRGGDKVLRPEPIDDSKEAKMTADALWEYQLLTHKKLSNYTENMVRVRQGLLPANFLLTRGAGFMGEVPSFQEKYNLNAACVAGGHLYKGIAKYFGMDVLDVPGATANTDTDVSAKVVESLESLNSGYDFVFMHVKGTDVVSEETGDFNEKIKFLERCDTALKPLLKFKGVLCVTGDHSTPCILKDHSTDPVPIMIIGGGTDKIKAFNEKKASGGSLGHLQGAEIMPKLLKEAESA
ncbi:MAG: 2,3-bisphosphoglycerate-independent phosphoglycerate mutase [Patescibacteria group bacterium]|nr:2,3-bisphosphoglycerate-independent phosphoglycerate mutase [Patescibacteria group bacterium]